MGIRCLRRTQLDRAENEVFIEGIYKRTRGPRRNDYRGRSGRFRAPRVAGGSRVAIVFAPRRSRPANAVMVDFSGENGEQSRGFGRLVSALETADVTYSTLVIIDRSHFACL